MQAGPSSNVSVTLASYEQGLDAYLEHSLPIPVPLAYEAFLHSVLRRLPRAPRMLSSGADPVTMRCSSKRTGCAFQRTNGARAFVERP